MSTENENGVPAEARDWKVSDNSDIQSEKFNLGGFSHKGDHETSDTSLSERISIADQIEQLQDRETHLDLSITELKSKLKKLTVWDPSGRPESTERASVVTELTDANEKLESVRRELQEKRDLLSKQTK